MNHLTTTFNQVKQTKPTTIRGIARNMALTALSVQNKLPNSIKNLLKPRVQFLYIHHVFDDEITGFDNLLNELSKHHVFISYSEAVERILNDQIDQPYISISSDDGFKNNLKAAEILIKYNVSACFFINPDTIGLKNYSQIKHFCNTKLRFPPTEFMNWNDVDELLRNGHEIGSHTMGHINVAETDLSILEDNLNESFRIIKEKCGRINHFAFPYGRFFHFNKISKKMVFDAGYTSCASAERGCHVSPKKILKPEELFIRRDHVICDWNQNHIMYFILNNSKHASSDTNLSPYK